MGIISSIKAAYIRLCERVEKSADQLEAERLALEAARKEHKAFKERTSRLSATVEKAYEAERDLAVARKSKLVGIADVVAGRKELKETDRLIAKADKLLDKDPT